MKLKKEKISECLLYLNTLVYLKILTSMFFKNLRFFKAILTYQIVYIILIKRNIVSIQPTILPYASIRTV